MKIITVEQPKKEKIIKYPCLLAVDTYPCVLFSESGVGIVLIATPGAKYKAGDISKTWVMLNFKPYRGSITLTNDDLFE